MARLFKFLSNQTNSQNTLCQFVCHSAPCLGGKTNLQFFCLSANLSITPSKQELLR
nr:MAG TPA: hypothetical protein [Caudoviricetes sp.]